MKRFERQYITLYAVLGELRVDQAEDEDLQEKLFKTQKKAYASVNATWESIAGRIERDHEMDVEVFELCENDVETVEREGFLCHGIGFFSRKNLPVSILKGMRECVERAYVKAGAEDGVQVRFSGASRMNVVEVTETSEIDFDSETPAID